MSDAFTDQDVESAPYCAVYAEHKDWLICQECGQVQSVVALSPEHEMVCFNCDSVLNEGRGRWLEVASALAVTSFLLFIFAVFSPLMTLEIGSQSQTINVIDGFWALMQRDNWLLAALIITTLFFFPLFEIFAFLYLLIPYNFNKRLPGQAMVLRWLILVQAWSMLEVFLLSMVVAAVKMADMAVLNLEYGAYALFILVGVLLFAYLKIDRRKLWYWINPNNYFTTTVGEAVHDCTVCKAMIGSSIVKHEKHCPRCSSEVHERIPHSIQKTTAFTIAAILLYIPANVLPIMTYSTLGETDTDTILSGVIELVAAGLWGVATIVFVASIAVPIVKLVILAYLIWAVQSKVQVGAKHRTFLYKLTEIIGRWSMVDVFVVTIFVAIVQFGFVYTVEAEGAIIAFGAVVVLTMLAAESFDPRLLWDAVDEKNDQ